MQSAEEVNTSICSTLKYINLKGLNSFPNFLGELNSNTTIQEYFLSAGINLNKKLSNELRDFSNKGK